MSWAVAALSCQRSPPSPSSQSSSEEDAVAGAISTTMSSSSAHHQWYSCNNNDDSISWTSESDLVNYYSSPTATAVLWCRLHSLFSGMSCRPYPSAASYIRTFQEDRQKHKDRVKSDRTIPLIRFGSGASKGGGAERFSDVDEGWPVSQCVEQWGGVGGDKRR